MVKRILSALLVLVIVLSMSVGAFAAEPEDELKNDVYAAVAGNSYAKSGGGHMTGDELFKFNGNSYDLDGDAVSKLTSDAQTQLVKDIKAASDSSVENNDEVSTETVQTWFKELQTMDGMGSKLLSTILANTKPDFVAANKIYQPFSGVIGVILGLVSILLMAFLGVVMVLDISYIALPPVRMFIVEQSEKGDKSSLRSNIVSHDAIYAVHIAEDTDGKDGPKKQALGVYLKRRIPMLILLGVCLLYLVQGQIYVLVSAILDLVSGFLGF
jgi:hypothetical protein